MIRPTSARCLIGCLCGLVAFAGCHAAKAPIRVQPPYTVYRSPQVVTHPPRRVLVVPIETELSDHGYMGHWCRLLTVELRSIKQFEVVTPSMSEPCVTACIASAKRGQFSEAAVSDVRRFYNVDGVLFVRMDDFYPYWPPRIAVSTHLVDTETGAVVSSLDGNWDGRDDRIQLLAKEFAQHMTASQDFSDPDLILNSPEYYGKFVAHQVAIAIYRSFFDEMAAANVSSTPLALNALTESETCGPQCPDQLSATVAPLVPKAGHTMIREEGQAEVELLPGQVLLPDTL